VAVDATPIAVFRADVACAVVPALFVPPLFVPAMQYVPLSNILVQPGLILEFQAKICSVVIEFAFAMLAQVSPGCTLYHLLQPVAAPGIVLEVDVAVF
jgi:hypothetical protein